MKEERDGYPSRKHEGWVEDSETRTRAAKATCASTKLVGNTRNNGPHLGVIVVKLIYTFGHFIVQNRGRLRTRLWRTAFVQPALRHSPRPLQSPSCNDSNMSADLSSLLSASRALTSHLAKPDLPSVNLTLDQIEAQSRRLVSRQTGASGDDARAYVPKQ